MYFSHPCKANAYGVGSAYHPRCGCVSSASRRQARTGPHESATSLPPLVSRCHLESGCTLRPCSCKQLAPLDLVICIYQISLVYLQSTLPAGVSNMYATPWSSRSHPGSGCVLRLKWLRLLCAPITQRESTATLHRRVQQMSSEAPWNRTKSLFCKSARN